MGEKLRGALAPILVGLDADGYGANVRETPDRVYVEITAKNGSCSDCLTPRSVMEPVITTLLREAGYEQTLVLTYPASD